MKTRGIPAILSALVVKAGIAKVNHSYRELREQVRKIEVRRESSCFQLSSESVKQLILTKTRKKPI
jgi:hypothetical protein